MAQSESLSKYELRIGGAVNLHKSLPSLEGFPAVVATRWECRLRQRLPLTSKAVRNLMEAAHINISSQSALQILSDNGTGRAFIVLLDDSTHATLASGVGTRLSLKSRSIVILSQPVTHQTWKARSIELRELLQNIGVRQVSFVCFGSGATLAQNLALEEPKMVRVMVIIDASSRPHPSRWDRMIDRIEGVLPLGLPLRLASSGFNVRSYLHRLRCPLLVVTTRRATNFLRDDADTVSCKAPTAWRVNLQEPAEELEQRTLADVVMSFQDIPARCPQKNVRE